MKKQKANPHEGITWSEMGKQNIQAKEVYCLATKMKQWKLDRVFFLDQRRPLTTRHAVGNNSSCTLFEHEQ